MTRRCRSSGRACPFSASAPPAPATRRSPSPMRSPRAMRRAARRRRKRASFRPRSAPSRSRARLGRRAETSARRCTCSATGGSRPSSTSRTTSASRTSRSRSRRALRSIEHVKRYTTTGMATDQGKLSNMNALAIAAAVQEKSIPEVGLTTFRPPYTPVTFGAFAGPARGELFDPIRKTPIHDWAAERGAAFEDVGLWKRAWYFPRDGETMREAVARECRTVRASVGLFDASTLGKIEVVGPDAAVFLERMYVNAFREARSRPLPLRPHADGDRLRSRRRRDRAAGAGPVPCDDDDRRRAARARPHGGLSPDGVHRT